MVSSFECIESVPDFSHHHIIGNVILIDISFWSNRCSHCRVLAPTWETLAKVMLDANEESEEEGGDEYGEQELRTAEALDVPVVIAKVRDISTLSHNERQVVPFS